MSPDFLGHPRARVPVVVVTGIDDAAISAAMISLQFGAPDAVAVRHRIDAERAVLVRTVSDLGGVVEHEEMPLDHVCVPCAIREDIVPALQRLAAQGRWRSIIAGLPVSAEATQVCRSLGWNPSNAPQPSVAGVVAALDGARIADDLLGDDLLDERGLALSPEDRRGVAEVACSLVEYADAVALTAAAADAEWSLLRTLVRPGAAVLADTSLLDAEALIGVVRSQADVERWVAPSRAGDLAPVAAGGAWRLDLRSDRPLHPLRFRDELAVIGAGPRRSRGCFWLPSRPDHLCVWDGAGGQVSIGIAPRGRADQRMQSRIVVIGLDDDPAERAAISAAFERSLVTEAELAAKGWRWAEGWDGFEPWLGPIAGVA